MLAFFGEMNRYRARVSALHKFLKKQKVDPILRVAIIRHFSANSGSSAQEAKTLEQLPVSLKREVFKVGHATPQPLCFSTSARPRLHNAQLSHVVSWC